MTTRAEFIATVRSYIGTPYHHQGRLPGVGMDCPGPLILAARAHGIVAPDFDVTSYSREPDGHTLKRLLDDNLEPIPFDDAEPGDVLLGRFNGGRPRHIGILTDNTSGRRYWIEAEAYRHRMVIEARLILGPRIMTIVQAYRVPGLEP
jgi:cell wall-associated NlpC family hydrolase